MKYVKIILLLSIFCSIINILYSKKDTVKQTNLLSLTIAVIIYQEQCKDYYLAFYCLMKLNTLFSIYELRDQKPLFYMNIINLFAYISFICFHFRKKL